MQRTLIYLTSKLRYDVENIAYIVSQQVTDENKKRMIADICQKNNMDRVTRQLDLAFAEADRACTPYTRYDIPSGRDYNDPSDAAEYRIMLTMPDNVSRSTINLVKESINEYVIWMVLYDWLTLTAPEMAGPYQGKTEELKKQIRSALTLRTRPTTIKPSTL